MRIFAVVGLVSTSIVGIGCQKGECVIRRASPKLVAFAVATAVSLGQTIGQRGLAQPPTAAVLSPAFDAASLKPAGTAFIPGVGLKGGPGTDDPGRISYGKVYLPELVTTAWSVEEYQVAGPAWLTPGPDQLYALTATMPPDTTKDQFHLMLQNLLIERFHMRVHHETRTLSGYELVVAPSGPKLKETTQDPDAPPGRITGVAPDGFPLMSPGRGVMAVMAKDGVHFKAQACTIEAFLGRLQGFISQTVEPGFRGSVVDKTGLTGRYDFALKFGGRNAPGGGRSVAIPGDSGPNTVDDPDGLPGLFAALEKQLGLKLVRIKKAPVDMLVIDYMDRVPTPN